MLLAFKLTFPLYHVDETYFFKFPRIPTIVNFTWRFISMFHMAAMGTKSGVLLASRCRPPAVLICVCDWSDVSRRNVDHNLTSLPNFIVWLLLKRQNTRKIMRRTHSGDTKTNRSESWKGKRWLFTFFMLAFWVSKSFCLRSVLLHFLCLCVARLYADKLFYSYFWSRPENSPLPWPFNIPNIPSHWRFDSKPTTHFFGFFAFRLN